MIKALGRHRVAVSIVGLFVALATTYSLVTPVFEASDEISHYPVVDHIATTGQFPVQHVGVKTLWEQEGSQPPLYYLLGAVLTFWIDTRDLESIQILNPHAKLGIPLDPDNKNMILHSDAEAFPWHGTTLAVHLLRLVGIALGATSVALCYMLGLTIWPDQPRVATLASALMAFNPMFLFISGSVNNDTLIIPLATATLLLCARILQSGLTFRRSIALAIVISLATITKISGLTLLPLVGLALLIYAWRSRRWRATIVAALIIGGVWLVFASWWYIRNMLLYGELLGTDMQVAIAGGRHIAILDLLRDESYGFWVSYWALFGAVNILADPIVYWLYGILSAAGLLGSAIWIARRIRAKEWKQLLIPGLLALQILVVLIGLIRWTLMTYASQGRLMFPVIAAISLLLAQGILQWIPERFQKMNLIALTAPLLAIAAFSPFVYIAPTYERAPIVASVPTGATPVGANFDGLELVAVEAQSVSLREAGFVPITLYWRATKPLDKNISVFIHALGRNYQEVGKIDSYPGAGTWPTKRLPTGTIIKDTYQIELNDHFQTPTVIRAQIGAGIWRDGNYTTIDGVNIQGKPFGDVIVEAGVAYPKDMQAGCNLSAQAPGRSIIKADFEEFAVMSAIELSERVSPGDTIPVRLIWEQIGEPGGNWTVFVQLQDDSGTTVAQADSPPLNNDYPTRLWRIPCRVEDTHELVLPTTLKPGSYYVLVGLYDASQPTYPRASVTDLTGAPYPDNAVPLGSVIVEAP